MKRSLKWRFIGSAMVAFFVMIVLVVGSIVLISYVQSERSSEEFLERVLDFPAEVRQEPPPNLFGYRFDRLSSPSSFYSVYTDKNGQILSMDKTGRLHDDEAMPNLIVSVLESGQCEGKTGSYMYRMAASDEGAHIVLLDRTPQVIALYTVLRAGAGIGCVCLLLLFLILQPVANRLAGAWLRQTEQQKQFITNASHELKTPVAIIMSNTEALELVNGESKYSRNILRQSQRLDKLIKHLLMMARADELRYTDRQDRIDLSELLQKEAVSFEQLAQERELTFAADVHPGLSVKGHRESLRQLIHVLLDNTVHYSTGGSSVSIMLHRGRSNHQLSLTNQVDSLPDCEPDQLLERFSRSDTAHQNSDGFGVGLAAARMIAELHRGNIRITYPNEHTFAVTVQLPAERK